MLSTRVASIVALAIVLVMGVSQAAPSVKSQACVMCMGPQECLEPCAEGFYCHVYPHTCTACGNAVCEPNV
ncbi:hypothetical protein BGZ83_011448 [Gryganskiella cystojenkinii]|nr:hypothetical protein BGZ83_011448 [Gryganskiella cystojenkinii]